MRLERLTESEEDRWRSEFGRLNWILGSISLSVTLPEFAEGKPKVERMHFGYYLQPLHLSVEGREELPRKLLWSLAHRKPPLDFLEMAGAGVRIPHAFPKGFTLGSVLRIILQEMEKLPVVD
jgi:hypothetical protein